MSQSPHRHFATPEALAKTELTLPRAEARHMVSVLRLRQGDTVQLFDGCGQCANFRINSVDRNSLTLTRDTDIIRHPPPRCSITLAACMSKGRRMDWIVEKSVELGVAAIVPVISDFSAVRLNKDEAAAKRLRWLRVATDAARQCGAPFIPEISEPLEFFVADDYLRRRCAHVFVGALSPASKPFREVLAALRLQPPPKAVAFFTGPEGDFSPSEYEALSASGATFVSLGNLVLRAETAAIYGLSVLGAEWQS